MRDGGGWEADRAIDALVERPVAATGAHAQLAPAFRFAPDFVAGIHGRGRKVNLVCKRLVRRQRPDLLLDLPAAVLFAPRDGVDDKKVFHIYLPVNFL